MMTAKRWAFFAGFTVLVALTASIAIATRPSAIELLIKVEQAKRVGDFGTARRLITQAVALYPQSAAMRVAAAELEVREQHFKEALDHLAQVVDERSGEFRTALGMAGELLFQQNRLADAERNFERLLQMAPSDQTTLRRRAMLLAIVGRRTASELLLDLIKRGSFGTHELILLGNPEQAFENPTLTQHFDEPLPDDFLVQLGAARFALLRHELSKASSIYVKLAAQHPVDFDVLEGLGFVKVESGNDKEFLIWHDRLPQSADERAGIWLVRGFFALRRQERDVAIRCFWEAIRRDPNLWQANSQIAALLDQQGDSQTSQLFQRRAEQLHQYFGTLQQIQAASTQAKMVQAADHSESLGRYWEAWGWCLAAAAEHRDFDIRERANRLTQRLTVETPQTSPDGNPALRFNLSSYPLPNWKELASSDRRALVSAGSPWLDDVTFADLASPSGLNFTYYNGHDRDVVGMRIFESLGGGVAVIDYDGDSWPDLYFTQGCDWPPRPGQTKHLDRLFRNLGTGQFVDITHHSRLGDERYSQGTTVGDFDSDGFSDLYVANIGANRLYRNNGDGTFTDWTDRSGLSNGGWTTSCVMVDLNQDGFPEIYDVTYVAGDQPFEKICRDEHSPGVCSPTIFDAEPDRLFLNLGNGEFQDISASASIDVPNGKGLGIAVGDFDDSGQLSIYVANDTTPNFLFVKQPQSADVPSFLERAVLSNCAFDLQGRAQASMGIAVDDSNGDGRLDLYITNFYRECSVLYVQEPGGLFCDKSRQAGLKEPSLFMLGFGTQFIDGDLDGWPDLVVANGHVDDYRVKGIPFRMRAQYFANLGHGVFAELPARQLGSYFQSELLGRGLARVDWNRDGREDFVVSNLDSPASLVTNRSPKTGHFLAIQLRGVQSNRDAIGTTVEILAGGRRRRKQLTAGDGYQASNQRQLVFGLGDDVTVEELSIRWPTGREQSFQNVAADTEYLLVEGRSELAQLPETLIGGRRSDMGGADRLT